MKIWLEPNPVLLPSELSAFVGGHPIVAETLARRGITTPDAARAFLDPDSYTPASPFDLPGMDAAVERISRALRGGERVCVWGDFDVDGQTSTAILVSTLQALGAKVSFHIPVRARESHGVNIPVLEQIIADGAQLVLTCDTGIAAHEAVEFARTKGVDFVITDHHELPETLSAACAVVNPHLLPTTHPLATLPGAGVAYKLAEALLQTFQPANLQPSHLFDLAALGIVADVATLTGEARTLVQRGLQVLRKAERPGLRAMMETAQVNPAWLTEEHIGFALGPRLNALGRLSDANASVELLTTNDWARARVLAATLEGLNAQRQLLTAQIFQAAQAQIEREPALLDEPVFVLSHPAWHAGVIGIVASRLVEQYSRPVVLLSAPEGKLARGSARSVEGINITAAIAEQKELLAGFGGHPMAAGLGLDAANIPAFRRGLVRSIAAQADGRRAEPVLQVDAALSLSEITLDLVEDVSRLAPFGAGNPSLVFAIPSLTLKSHSSIGRGGEHRQMIVTDAAGSTRKVLWWQGAGWPLPQGRFDLACTIRASDYRGQRDVQVEWVDFRPLEAIEIVTPKKEIAVHDYRQQAQPMALLKQLTAEGVPVWAEADAREKLAELGVTALARHELAPAKLLAIWTSPPGPLELHAALKLVQPERVTLFGVNPATASTDEFLRRLTGLVKYALHQRKGQAKLDTLVAATAQTELAVRTGLAWLAAHGYIVIADEEGGLLQLIAGSGEIEGGAGLLHEQLDALLSETSAYRAYFRKADGFGLLSGESECCWWPDLFK
jgi:single-stranded-DNA-specific exonuclease